MADSKKTGIVTSGGEIVMLPTSPQAAGVPNLNPLPYQSSVGAPSLSPEARWVAGPRLEEPVQLPTADERAAAEERERADRVNILNLPARFLPRAGRLYNSVTEPIADAAIGAANVMMDPVGTYVRGKIDTNNIRLPGSMAVIKANERPGGVSLDAPQSVDADGKQPGAGDLIHPPQQSIDADVGGGGGPGRAVGGAGGVGGGGGGGSYGGSVPRMAPEAMAAWADYFKIAPEAAQAMQDEKAARAAALENHYAQQIEDQDARERAVAKAEDGRRQELERRQLEYDAAVKDLSSHRLDPNRFWSSKGVVEQMASIFAVYLGGLAGHMDRTGRNVAIEELNKQRDLDIEAQKHDFSAKQAGTRGKETAFSMAMQRFGDERVAEKVAKAAAIERQQAELQRVGARFDSSEAKARMGVIQTDLARQYAEVMQSAFALPAPAAGGGGGGGVGDGGEGVLDPSKAVLVGYESDGTPKYVVTRSDTQAREIDKQLAAQKSMMDDYAKALEIAREHPHDVYNPLSKYHQQMVQLRNDIMAKRSTSTGQGAVQRAEEHRSQKGTGIDLDILPGVLGAVGAGPTLADRIEAARAASVNENSAALRALEGQPVVAGHVSMVQGKKKGDLAVGLRGRILGNYRPDIHGSGLPISPQERPTQPAGPPTLPTYKVK